MSNDIEFFKQIAREDLLAFASYNDKFFKIVDIHKKMAKALEDISTWKSKRLILELPPRSGKSRITSEFVAWYLWHNPEKDVILTGHSSSLLEQFSRNIRDRINSDEYKTLFDTKLAAGNTAVKSWKTDKGWEFSIFWVGWWITWKWGHLLICDDPYSWREDAESDTIKDKTWEWYKSTFLSRRQNENSAIIIIMQRWAEDDLVWRLLEEQESEWNRITIPAIDSDNKSFWPEKFSVEYLENMRKEIWEYFFMSQYQQDPVNEGSGDFNKDMFQYYEKGEIDDKIKRMHITSFIDPAISQKQEADSTAIVTIWTDIKTNLIYLLEIKKIKEAPDWIIAEVFDTTDKRKGEWMSYRMWIEVVAYQKMLALELKKQMRLKDKHFMLEEIRPQWEKNSRIRAALQWRYSSGSILHCKNISNTSWLETELLKFPNWKHDDMIDSLASCVAMSKVNSVWRKKKIYVPDYI